MNIEVIENKDGILVEDPKKILAKLYESEKNLEYEERTPQSKLYNKFTGSYWSPTFLKGFMNCPAKCFLEALTPRVDSPYANTGSCTHKIFERLVKEGMPVNTKLGEQITFEEINNYNVQPGLHQNYVKNYVKSFFTCSDYLNSSIKFPWDKVDTFPEAFYKSEIEWFGVNLGSLYTLIDRIDIRDEGIFIIDYKTGDIKLFNEDLFKDLYTNQFIAYKMAIEKEMGMEVAGCYAYHPGLNRYIDMPVNSLERQSILVEKVIEYYDFIKEQNESGIYKEIVNDGCKYCKFKTTCNALNNTEEERIHSFDISLIS